MKQQDQIQTNQVPTAGQAQDAAPQQAEKTGSRTSNNQTFDAGTTGYQMPDANMRPKRSGNVDAILNWGKIALIALILNFILVILLI